MLAFMKHADYICVACRQKQCDGQHWKAHGKHETIPGDFNNKLRSVKCN